MAPPTRRERRAQRRAENRRAYERFCAPYLRDEQARGKGTAPGVQEQEIPLSLTNSSKTAKTARWRQLARNRKGGGAP